MACYIGKPLQITSTDIRINYNLMPGETLTTCPYDESHAILQIKFNRHVNKCYRRHCKEQRKKGQPPLYSICQYDRSHHFKNAELADHEATCTGRVDAPDNWGSDDALDGWAASQQFRVILREPLEPTQEDLDTEDWDAEPDSGWRFQLQL